MERLGISTLMHFLVDGLCLCCLYLVAARSSAPSLVGVFVVYNVLAFLTQPLTGACIDRLRQQHWMLLASVLLLTLAVASASADVVVPAFHDRRPAILLTATLLGVGNSLFHVWGGKQVVRCFGNDMRPLGLFVSTGAMGLAVSTVWCSWPLLYAFLVAIGLLAVLYVCCDSRPVHTAADERRRSGRFSPLAVLAALSGLMVFVMMRSFLSRDFTAGFSPSAATLLTVGAVTMAGKMAGGWIARRTGIVQLFALMVVVVGLVVRFGQTSTWVLLSALFVVNCTMPVTLYLANHVLKGREGLAFGLLAAALVPGYLLAAL